MKKYLLATLGLTVLFSVATISAAAQRPDSVTVFIDSALNIMQRHSMYSSKVNWKKVRDSVELMAGQAKTYDEAAPALHYAFNSLGDKHGYLVINNIGYHNMALKTGASRVNENMKLAASKGPRIYKGIVREHYAYLSVPFNNVQSLKGANDFAQAIQDSLCSVINSGTKGIILDLRLNAGGNTFAMIAGLSNVFGNQAPPKGKAYVGDWKIDNYGLSLNDTFRIQLQHHCGDYSKLPVAILVGPVTASAGEYLALGFTTRRNTVLIGERTAGYTSGNNGFFLPGKNNGIVVAEDYAVDKEGNVYTDGIPPSIEVQGGDDFFNRDADKKIQAAINWLQQQVRE